MSLKLTSIGDMEMTSDHSNHGKEHKQPGSMSVKQILSSVFAAALGVQSSKNRERDFKQGSIKIFIAAGLIFTALFIGGVITVVNLVTP